VLLTVRGFRASQRFKSLLPVPAPYLALHQVDSGAIFDSAEYRKLGGPASTGDWRALHLNWRRNLLEGLNESPDVPFGRYLLRLENARDLKVPVPDPVDWTEVVGLDWSAGEFGFVVLHDPEPFVELAHRDERVRLYRPISEKLRETTAS
jgi:hypothetical protein